MAAKLLVVDDAMIIRQMIKDTAQANGWEIAGEADNGQAAIEQYEKLRPDAVTLDLVMPEFNGIHALKGIKEIAPDARVIIVSALNQSEILKEALEIGASDFVVKPFKPDQILSALTKLGLQTGNNAVSV